jgi:subtilisin
VSFATPNSGSAWPASVAELLASDAAGQGVRVGIIDTGIDREALHRRSGGNLHLEGAIFAPGTKSPLPYEGRQSAPHGTAVAGILLHHAPRITLMSADVFGAHGRCEVETLLHAIQWCVDEAKCQVLNLSLGVTEDRLLPVQRRWHLQRVIEECYHRDVTVIAAAHNEHPAYRSFPAVLGAPLIGVTKGPWHDELVLKYRPDERVEFQATASASGDFLTQTPASSWAAPHVTALAARLLSQWPGLKPFEVKSMLYRLGP